MFEEIKKAIKENKKTFFGFLIMLISTLMILIYIVVNQEAKKDKEEVAIQKSAVVVQTTQKVTPAMPNYGSYLKEKDTTDFLMLILIVLFFVGIFLIISSKGKGKK